MTGKQDVIIKVVTACGLAFPAGHVCQSIVGEWLSLVEHLVRDQGVGGSNPLSPTNHFKQIQALFEIAENRL